VRAALSIYDASSGIIAHASGAKVMSSDRDGLFHALVQGIIVIDDRRDVRAR
jgi:hypothetical protein